MTYFPLRYRKLHTGVIVPAMILASCASYSTTQQNIKKVNDALNVKITKTTPVAVQQPAQKTPDDSPGSIPLSQFLDSRTPTALQSTNPWFSRVRDWARTYIDIAKSERDVRNYGLSSKYSALGVKWADRSLQIKDLPTEAAEVKIKLWLEQLQLPNLPETSKYYTAQDVYKKIFDTKNILQGFQHKFCLIEHGVQIVPALAYLDLSIDLYHQKKYSKALYKIQSGLASIENVTQDDDKKCEDAEASESDDLK